MFTKLNNIYHDYPRRFWVLVGVRFVDGIGGTLLFPYFSLYITSKFNVGMTQAGLLLGIFSIMGMVGSMIGGALTDKYGRKSIMLIGLVFSALSELSMGLVNSLSVFYVLAIFVGLLSSLGEPANQAMIADILPEEKRSSGFGIMRVVGNMTWIIGPTIGGFVAGHSYLSLFIIDTVFSLITAILVFIFIEETKPAIVEKQEHESLGKTIIGYIDVLKNKTYLAFILVSMTMMIVYTQMYSTLSVFMHKYKGFGEQSYGMILSASAVLVIFTQLWITRKTEKKPPMILMAIGAFLYGVGFTLFGFVNALWLFVVGVLIITVGEMLVVPTGQSLVALFSPEDMRGRYMAAYGLAWAIPQTIGPTAAGLIMDNYNPNWVWYLGGIISLVAVCGFILLNRHVPALKIQETNGPVADAVK